MNRKTSSAIQCSFDKFQTLLNNGMAHRRSEATPSHVRSTRMTNYLLKVSHCDNRIIIRRLVYLRPWIETVSSWQRTFQLPLFDPIVHPEINTVRYIEMPLKTVNRNDKSTYLSPENDLSITRARTTQLTVSLPIQAAK